MSGIAPALFVLHLNRAQLRAIISERLPEMVRLFDIKNLRLFGSAARDELRDESDVDILGEFNATATYTGYMGLKFHLEDLLCRRVDLVTTQGLRRGFRPAVEQEAILVA